MSDRSTRTRHPLRRRFNYCVDAAGAGLPYGLAAVGLALGAAGLLAHSPVTGAGGAVAGVAGGLVATFRSRRYRGQLVALRERLRRQRAAADGAASGLRARVSTLEVTLWERQVLAAGSEPVAAAEPVAAKPRPAVAGPRPAVADAGPVAVEAGPVGGGPAERPAIRLAYAAARLTVPRTVLAAAVATTGSLSLADIAAAAERKAAERDTAAPDSDSDAAPQPATSPAASPAETPPDEASTTAA